MKRKDARENAFKVLFELSFSKDADVDETVTLSAENLGYEFDDYCIKLIKGVAENKEDAKANKAAAAAAAAAGGGMY